MAVNDQSMKLFNALLREHGIASSAMDDMHYFEAGGKKISVKLRQEVIKTSPRKLVSVIRSRLHMNRRLFARNCSAQRIGKTEAQKFLNKYHLMNSASCAYCYGLFFEGEPVAVAIFSKGRKMHRLPAHLRSFELIRFCCREGITVTGGLSKLVKTFSREKNAGDVMTYIDPQFSMGESYFRAGFKKLEDDSHNRHQNIKLVFLP